jgi:threonine dehydrogenase-like Zn-dependent dehydrogenase
MNMRAIYLDKNIPRALLTKAVSPWWPGFVWTPFSAVHAVTLPEPPLPGPRWVRLRNERCGICASDLSLLYVHAHPAISPAALPGNKRIFLGHETLSTVEEVGQEVTRFKPGDRAIMDTHFAGANCATLQIDPPCRYCAEGEFHYCINQSLPGPRGVGGGFGDQYVTHEMAVYPCPPDLSPDQAALTEPLSVGVHTVLSFPPQPGEHVLVIGAGAIALLLLAAIHALYPECEVSVIARYPHQAQLAERLGARHIMNHSDYRQVAGLTGARFFSAPLNRGAVVGGFDVVYDCVADARTTNDALRWARSGGTVVMVGSHLSPMPRVDLTPIWYDHIRLVGTYSHGMDERDGVRKHTYEWVYGMFRGGSLETDALITHRFPFSDYREAIRVASHKGQERAVKVMMQTG